MTPLRTTQIISTNINSGNTSFRNIKTYVLGIGDFNQMFVVYIRVVNVEVINICVRMIMIKFEYKAGIKNIFLLNESKIHEMEMCA